MWSRSPRGAEEIRLDSKWVIPGLIDAHVHLERWAMSRYLAYGVTSVRGMGGDVDTLLALRDSIRLGASLGPRLFLSGPMVDGSPTTWGTATAVTDETQARRVVDQLVLNGFDHAKVYTKLNRRLLTALVDEAMALDVPVAAHLGRVDAVTAARIGVASLEHMSGVVEASLSDPADVLRSHNDFFRGWRAFERTWAQLDSARLERTVRRLRETEVAIVPTLVLHETFGHLADENFAESIDLAGVPPWVQERWDVPDLIRRARLTNADFRAFRRSRPKQDLFVRRFRAAGGLVAAGSDSPNQLLAPGASLHQELWLLVEAGLSAEDAILAATRDAARLLRVDSIGVILPGKVADFLVLSGNPLDDITNSSLIHRIVYRGAGYRPEDFKTEW